MGQEFKFLMFKKFVILAKEINGYGCFEQKFGSILSRIQTVYVILLRNLDSLDSGNTSWGI
jgi:hypothetical protein